MNTQAAHSFKTWIVNQRRKIAGCIITALLLALSYPKFNVNLLAFAAFAPLTVILENSSRKEKIFFCYFTGIIFYCSVLYWITPTCMVGGVNLFMSLLALAMLALVLALQWALFGFLCSLTNLRGIVLAVYISCAWVVGEWLFMLLSQYGVWFPWFLLGYTQWQFVSLIQAANITGTMGISFLVIYFGVSLGKYLNSSRNKKQFIRFMQAPVIAFIVFCVYGALYMKFSDEKNAAHLKISLIQPNIDQYKKWDETFEKEIENTLEKLLAKAKAENPDLIVWPESVLPMYFENYTGMLKNAGAKQIIGAYSQHDYNRVSVYLLDENANIKSVYNKRVLVPFGESVPFKKTLGKYVKVLNKMGSFDAGNKKQPLFAFTLNNTTEIKAGPTICYETIFPFLWKTHANDGAQLFVNSTNDGWYLNTAAPYQHFAATALRAAEFSIPVARATNTGISAFINRFGEVQNLTKLNEETVLTGTLNVKNESTVYSKIGNLFAFLCAAFLCTAILTGKTQKERSS